MPILDQSNISKEKYHAPNYQKKERFLNYWNQINEVLNFKPQSVLEVGVGSKTVYNILQTILPNIISLDINKELKPDIVGSVESIPIPNNHVDIVLAAEILEHLPFDSFEKSLREIYRVCRKGAVISLPHQGATFSLSLKIPALKWIQGVFKIPYFWKSQTMTPEHFWEVGLKSYPYSRVKRVIEKVGFKIKKKYISHDDIFHLFLILEK